MDVLNLEVPLGPSVGEGTLFLRDNCCTARLLNLAYVFLMGLSRLYLATAFERRLVGLRAGDFRPPLELCCIKIHPDKANLFEKAMRTKGICNTSRNK